MGTSAGGALGQWGLWTIWPGGTPKFRSVGILSLTPAAFKTAPNFGGHLASRDAALIAPAQVFKRDRAHRRFVRPDDRRETDAFRVGVLQLPIEFGRFGIDFDVQPGGAQFAGQ